MNMRGSLVVAFTLTFTSALLSSTAAAENAADNAVNAANAPLDAVMNAAAASGFSGVVLVGDETRVLYEKSLGLADRATGTPNSAALPWRWASVSKQVTAAIAAQLIDEGKLALDRSVADYLSAAQFPAKNARAITIRHLLQHTSGLPNPSAEDSPTNPIPLFYRRKVAAASIHSEPTRGFCAGLGKGAPGAAFEYNNCDYLVLGAVIEQLTGRRFAEVLAARISQPLKLASVKFVSENNAPEVVKGYEDASQPEPAVNLATYGASGALMGTPRDLLALDRALLGEGLLSRKSKEQFWAGNPKLGYVALGVWSFPATLKGCKGAVELIERRGAISGIQVRNIIAPKLSRALVVFTNRGDWEFGEIWQGKGFSYELLSAALCGAS